MKTNLHSKKGVRTNCFTVFIFLAMAMFILSAFFVDEGYAAVSNLNDFAFGFNFPYGLRLKYSVSTSEGEHFYVFNCSAADKSFLDSFNEKSQSEYIDYFFKNITDWQDENVSVEADKIAVSDSFTWSYALRSEIYADNAPGFGTAIALYKPANDMLYCYYYYQR